MNVLFIIDHAADYRESFLRDLASKCLLTVIAQPCEYDNLTAPNSRYGYEYFEISTIRVGPFRLCKIPTEIELHTFNVICVDFNLRHLWRFYYFSKQEYLNKLVWWGHIFGRYNGIIIDLIRKRYLNNSRAILTQSKSVNKRVDNIVSNILIKSFNNTQIDRNDFIKLPWSYTTTVNLLFVGRPQERKRLDRLVKLARYYKETNIRLIGPDMLNFILTNTKFLLSYLRKLK